MKEMSENMQYVHTIKFLKEFTRYIHQGRLNNVLFSFLIKDGRPILLFKRASEW